MTCARCGAVGTLLLIRRVMTFQVAPWVVWCQVCGAHGPPGDDAGEALEAYKRELIIGDDRT